jgi:hypothetical protein
MDLAGDEAGKEAAAGASETPLTGLPLHDKQHGGRLGSKEA